MSTLNPTSLACALALLAAATPPLAAQSTRFVSLNDGAAQGNGPSFDLTLDRDGSLAAFTSAASNLVMFDANGVADVFLRDVVAGTTTRVSVGSGGVEGNAASDSGRLASNGRAVAFRSDATNFSANDMNGASDIYLNDLAAGSTLLVSQTPAGMAGNGPSLAPFVSRNGLLVVFSSDATDLVPGDVNNQRDVFVFNVLLGTTQCISVDPFGAIAGNGSSDAATVSADGRYAVFASAASNLVPGDTNGDVDIFLRDLTAGVTWRINRSVGGGQANGPSSAPAISESGEVIVYQSQATNLVPNDNNGVADVFVFDRITAATERASVATNGTPGNDVSGGPVVSATGRFVAFVSDAGNLSPDDTNGALDVYVRDRGLKVTHRANLSVALTESALDAGGPALSANGRIVGWNSPAPDYVPGDVNAATDVFVHQRANADWRNYGAGFPGTIGVPGISIAADPVLGTDATLLISNSAGMATVGTLIVGLMPASVPQPWGGDLLVTPVQLIGLNLPGPVTQLPWHVDYVEAHEGASLFLQVIESDPGAQYGVSSTPGLELRFGW